MKILGQMLVLLLVGMAAGSCQSVVDLAKEPAGAGPLAAVGRDSAETAYELSGQTWCSNDLACSMVLLLAQGEDRYVNFEQRLAGLEVKGLARADWRLQAEEPVTKGTLAYMLCRTLDIKGGVLMHLLPSRRYAYREAIYYELMERGSEYEPLTGPEAVGVLGRAARMSQP